MKKFFPLLPLLALWACTAPDTPELHGGKAAEAMADTPCPVMELQVERLPDLNIPRSGHTTLCLNGEVTVFGGHTDGFIPTPTAEYLSNGEWHVVPMTYAHDNGLCVPLSRGQVLLAGGHEQPLGIGQTFPAEMYYPAEHRFEGFGCLEHKRTLPSGLELDSGQVVIAGNWYARDSIELFDGKKHFHPVRSVNTQRATPYIFRTERNNAMILSGLGPRDERPCDTLADRLYGDPLPVPLMRQWRPLHFLNPFWSGMSQTGNEAQGEYAYLMPVMNDEGQLAIVRAQNGHCALLPTACPIPMETLWDTITYWSPVIADRQRGRGYVTGMDKALHLYVLCIDYAQASQDHPAPLRLYCSDPLPDSCYSVPVLTPQGDLVMVGGCIYNNFKPFSAVYRICLGDGDKAAARRAWPASWVWQLLVLLAAGIAVYRIFRPRRTRQAARPTTGQAPEPVPQEPAPQPVILPDETEEPAPQPATWPGEAEEPAPKPDTCKAEETEPKPETSEAEIPAAQPDTPQAQPEPAEPQGEAPRAIMNGELMERISQLVEGQKQFLNSELKISDVANALGTNSRYVSGSIKQARGCSFTHYVNTLRVEYAQQLIRQNPDIKVSQLCYDAGFTNDTHFFRTFKSITGTTPNEWRNTVMAQEE